MYEAGKSSVCVCQHFWCHRATLATSTLISGGRAQNESYIFWNMQDYVYNFTGMKHQNANASGVGYSSH